VHRLNMTEVAISEKSHLLNMHEIVRLVSLSGGVKDDI